MRWIEASIGTKPEEIDGLCETLAALGVQGVSIEDENDLRDFLERNQKYWDYIDDTLTEKFRGVSRVKFYLVDDESGRTALKRIRDALGREITTAYVDDENWEYTWRQYYAPIEVGERLRIVPEWLDPELNGRKALRLDPGLAFGTGSHATTRLCLEIMDGLDLAGKRVLDLGFGSGILSIGAIVLGAESAAGCDVDPNAVTAARQNAALNGIGEDKLKVCAGNVLTDEGIRKGLGGGYDLVLANIVADVILPLTGFARRFMAADGRFLCSGIIENRTAEIEAALKRNGFAIVDHRRMEEWHCYLCS